MELNSKKEKKQIPQIFPLSISRKNPWKFFFLLFSSLFPLLVYRVLDNSRQNYLHSTTILLDKNSHNNTLPRSRSLLESVEGIKEDRLLLLFSLQFLGSRAIRKLVSSLLDISSIFIKFCPLSRCRAVRDKISFRTWKVFDSISKFSFQNFSSSSSF